MEVFIHNGSLPGLTPANAFLPVVIDGAFNFDFNVQLNQMIFIDPDIAVGYELQSLVNRKYIY